MTISSSEIRRNMTIMMDDGELYQILEWQHRKAPKAPPTLTMKLRHIKTGNVYEKKVPGTHKLTQAPTERRSSQYLYKDGEFYAFMDTESYEQFIMDENILGDALNYLVEGNTIDVLMYQEKPLTVELPPTVNLTIAETEPGIKGDTQSGANKPAVTNTGLRLNVPLFINEGDVIIVNTSTGQYQGRGE